MNGVATKIAVEIGMFFENGDRHASSREQVTGHHTCRSAAYDDYVDDLHNQMSNPQMNARDLCVGGKAS